MNCLLARQISLVVVVVVCAKGNDIFYVFCSPHFFPSNIQITNIWNGIISHIIWKAYYVICFTWCLMFMIHTNIHTFSFFYTCVFHIRMLKALLLIFSSHTEECAGNKRKNIYLNVENRDYYEENVWQFFFSLSLSHPFRSFCVFTQDIIVKINENDGKYEENTCMKHYFFVCCFMIFP